MTPDEARALYPISTPEERAIFAEIMTMFRTLTTEEKREYILIAREFIKEKLK